MIISTDLSWYLWNVITSRELLQIATNRSQTILSSTLLNSECSSQYMCQWSNYRALSMILHFRKNKIILLNILFHRFEVIKWHSGARQGVSVFMTDCIIGFHHWIPIQKIISLQCALSPLKVFIRSFLSGRHRHKFASNFSVVDFLYIWSRRWSK